MLAWVPTIPYMVGAGRWGKAITSKAYLSRDWQIYAACPAQASLLAMGCAATHFYLPGGALAIKAEAGL